MKKIKILLVIAILALSGCTKKEVNNEIVNENVLTNESNTIISGDEIKEESEESFEDSEIISKEDNEMLGTPDEQEEEMGVLVSDYYDTYEELLYLYENDPFLKSLTDVNLPQGIEKIGRYAFYKCKSLENITIPSSVKIIYKRAFFECQALKNVNFKNGVKIIGVESFSYCYALKKVDIPNKKE